MGCKGSCDQGRIECPEPEECDTDLNAAFGIMSALLWTGTIFAVIAFLVTLYDNWEKL